MSPKYRDMLPNKTTHGKDSQSIYQDSAEKVSEFGNCTG